jgi:Uncharacterized conserved protein (DUF2163)
VQDRAKSLERIGRELEVTLFSITHEGSERTIAEHERRVAEIEALRARDGSNAQQVDQLIAQSAAVRDAQLSQLRAKELEAAGEVTTLATCWKITRHDRMVQGFTDHVRDLEVDGVTYEAASGYTRTAIRSTADLAVDNLNLESAFGDAGITEEDMHTGHYGNYESLVQGILSCGTAGSAICR